MQNTKYGLMAKFVFELQGLDKSMEAPRYMHPSCDEMSIFAKFDNGAGVFTY